MLAILASVMVGIVTCDDSQNGTQNGGDAQRENLILIITKIIRGIEKAGEEIAGAHAFPAIGKSNNTNGNANLQSAVKNVTENVETVKLQSVVGGIAALITGLVKAGATVAVGAAGGAAGAAIAKG